MMTSRTVRWDGFFSGCWDTYRKKINMFRSLNSKFKSYAEPESLESDLHSPPTHPKSVFLVDPGTELAGNQTTYLTVRDAELQPTVNSKL